MTTYDTVLVVSEGEASGYGRIELTTCDLCAAVVPDYREDANTAWHEQNGQPDPADVWDQAVKWARGHAAERRRWHDSEGRYPPTHEADHNPYRAGAQ